MNRFGSLFKPLMGFMALLLAAFVAGCGGGGDSGPATPASNGAVCTGTACVPLATAGTFVILSKSGISNVPTSVVTGNIGVSPIDSTAITGFAKTLDASGTFSTSAQVAGKIFAANYTAPTPANLTQAVTDAGTASTDAAGRTPGATNPTAGTLNTADSAGALPGVYRWTTGVAIQSDFTLTGSATDVWIFQIGGTLSQVAGTKVILAGGALPQNVFWQTNTNVSILAGAQFRGIILAGTNIALGNGASVDGRLFSGTAVTLNTNTITRP